ncbi:MAG: hypothetical protein GY940_27320 [bacterium]|nr:hypothetical protein [bacterium]
MNNQSLSLGGTPPPTAGIRSVTVISEVTPSLEQTPVPLPNWNQGTVDLSDGDGSTRPGVFLIPHGGERPSGKLRVEIALPRGKTFEKAQLTGQLSAITFTGFFQPDTDAIETVYTLELTATDEPSHFIQHRGQMSWTLTIDGKPFPVKPDGLPMELYWIYDYPGRMFKKGVWIEVLRVLATWITPELTCIRELVQRITLYCHLHSGLMYDCKYFSSYYTGRPWGVWLNLKGAMAEAFPLCNCYDQASLLQVALGALGIDVTYIYMRPFGFINTSSLVGRGACNNPGFLDCPEPTPLEELEIRKFLYTDSKEREGFGNHAFCLIQHPEGTPQTGVLDATVGPRLGNLSQAVYVTRGIDSNTSLYDPNSYLPRPGTKNDMRQCIGIIDVHGIPSEGDTQGALNLDRERVDYFKKGIGFDKIVKELEQHEEFVVCPWITPGDCPDIKNNFWQPKYHGTIGGIDAAEKEWTFTRKDECLRVKVDVSSIGPEAALRRMVMDSAATEKINIPFRKKEKRDGGLGFLELFNEERHRWVYGNVHFRIDLYNSSMDVAPLKAWLDRQVKTHITQSLEPYRPVIKNLTVTPSAPDITVGREITLSVEAGPGADGGPLMLEFFFPGVNKQNLRLVRESIPGPNDKTKIFQLGFIVRRSGNARVQVVLVNSKTLISSKPVGVSIIVPDPGEAVKSKP